ncbi:MAG: hypothetical protein IPI61_12245 [Syntrophaceae bacterium]|nr:hypothetical protein [Syntrophaceae bacterium]
MNAQHASGYDNYRNAGDLLRAPRRHGAEDMQVSAAILADPNRIAASATVNADGDNARAIAAIRDEILPDGVGIPGRFYASWWAGSART